MRGAIDGVEVSAAGWTRVVFAPGAPLLEVDASKLGEFVRWSPLGDELLFRDGAAFDFVSAVDGSVRSVAVDGLPAEGAFAWRPDGCAIAVGVFSWGVAEGVDAEHDALPDRLLEIEVGTGRVLREWDKDTLGGYPCGVEYSPDGAALLVSLEAGSRLRQSRLEFVGLGPLLSFGRNHGWNPSWRGVRISTDGVVEHMAVDAANVQFAPDGSGILYISEGAGWHAMLLNRVVQRKGVDEVRYVPFEGGVERVITRSRNHFYFVDVLGGEDGSVYLHERTPWFETKTRARHGLVRVDWRTGVMEEVVAFGEVLARDIADDFYDFVLGAVVPGVGFSVYGVRPPDVGIGCWWFWLDGRRGYVEVDADWRPDGRGAWLGQETGYSGENVSFSLDGTRVAVVEEDRVMKVNLLKSEIRNSKS